jgi:hypothetical protein
MASSTISTCCSRVACGCAPTRERTRPRTSMVNFASSAAARAAAWVGESFLFWTISSLVSALPTAAICSLPGTVLSVLVMLLCCGVLRPFR